MSAPTPTRPMALTVLLAVANRAYGGAERHVVDLANALAARGHSVTCLFPAHIRLQEHLVPAVDARAVSGLGSPLRLVAALARTVRAVKPDVVHLHSIRALMLGRFVRLSRLPLVRPALLCPVFVGTAHGWVPRRLRAGALFSLLYRVGARLDDTTIAVSKHTARRFGSWPRRVCVIPNGLATVDIATASAPAASGDASTGVRLGFVGRLTEEKDFPIALEALARARDLLQRRGWVQPVELHVYGDGPLLPAARARAEERCSGGVHFHGRVPQREVFRAMAELTALLVSSREEGFPYAVLEAMAVGCPVVATAVGGIPEIVWDGHTGLLAEPGDHERLAEAIAALALDPTLRDRLARAARASVAAYTLEAMVDAIEETYYQAVSCRRGLG